MLEVISILKLLGEKLENKLRRGRYMIFGTDKDLVFNANSLANEGPM